MSTQRRHGLAPARPERLRVLGAGAAKASDRQRNWFDTWPRKETLRCLHHEGSNVELPVNTPNCPAMIPDANSAALADAIGAVCSNSSRQAVGSV